MLVIKPCLKVAEFQQLMGISRKRANLIFNEIKAHLRTWKAEKLGITQDKIANEWILPTNVVIDYMVDKKGYDRKNLIRLFSVEVENKAVLLY